MGALNAIKNTLIVQKEWVKLAKRIHPNFLYNKTNYISAVKKVIITCPKHGDFTVTPNNHIVNRSGCPYCDTSKMELEIMKSLNEHSINFLYNKRQKWLKSLRLDFYLPDQGVAIECQGAQHFYPVGFGSKDKKLIEKQFQQTQEYDSLKLKLCEENGIKMIYYSNLKDYDSFLGHPIYHSIDELLKEILV